MTQKARLSHIVALTAVTFDKRHSESSPGLPDFHILLNLFNVTPNAIIKKLNYTFRTEIYMFIFLT